MLEGLKTQSQVTILASMLVSLCAVALLFSRYTRDARSIGSLDRFNALRY